MSSHQKYGYTQQKWNIFKTEARVFLIEEARRRGLITYGDLAAKMTTIEVEPHDMVLWDIIGDVARDEEAAGRGLLSALVVHKHGDMEPGPGFFDLAKYYHRNVRDRTICWINETKRIHKEWSVKQQQTVG